MKIKNQVKVEEKSLREGMEEEMDVFLRSIIEGKNPKVEVKDNWIYIQLSGEEVISNLIIQNPEDLKCLIYRAYLLGMKDCDKE